MHERGRERSRPIGGIELTVSGYWAGMVEKFMVHYI